LRVTIGERLGLSTVVPRPPAGETRLDDAAPTWVEPEVAGPILDLRVAPSSTLPWIHPACRESDGGPARVRGEMVWTKKDVCILQIEGHPAISPETYAENRRR
jgi:hypothetical protein